MRAEGYPPRVLVARVRRTVEEHRLLRPGERVLVGVSGGADSLALVRALLASREALGIELEAATIDHGLRAGSAAEHERVRTAIEALGIPCALVSLRLARGAAVQRRAREARYAALGRLATERGCDVVAVAHTLDDQAETVLARLLRGAGVRGLAGAHRRRVDGVVRPLLDATRAEVLAYLRAIAQPVLVEDPSNQDARYLRARVRHRLLPLLVREQPALARALAALADDAAEHRALVERVVGALAPRALASVEALAGLEPPLRREALRRWAREQARVELGRPHLEALERLCLTTRGEVRLPEGGVVLIQGGALTLRASPTSAPKSHPDEG